MSLQYRWIRHRKAFREIQCQGRQVVCPRHRRRGRRDPASDLRHRPRQHRHRLGAVPRGPGAGAGDGPEPRPAGAVAGRGASSAALSVAAFSPKFFGGVAEFASASIHLSNAIKDIYVQYEAAKASNAGMLPVVACTGSEAMKDRYGTNYRPTFKIVQWVERPKELPNQSPVDAADVWRGGNVARYRARQGARPARAAAGAGTQACCRRSAQRSGVLSAPPEGFGPPVLSQSLR